MYPHIYLVYRAKRNKTTMKSLMYTKLNKTIKSQTGYT